jgi:hypothetical protein
VVLQEREKKLKRVSAEFMSIKSANTNEAEELR